MKPWRYICGLLSALLLSVLPPDCAAAPDGGMVEVRGRLIDIRTAEAGAEVYPQYRRHRFGRSLPQRLAGMDYAVGLREFAGPQAVRASRECDLLLAVADTLPDTVLWRATGEAFFVNRNGCRLHRCLRAGRLCIPLRRPTPAPSSGARANRSGS